jgi:HAD superfamily hydrolase (TIGR01484 family)
VASDLDGTLFNKEIRVSEENLIAIEKIAKLGVEFVPTTGRTLAADKVICSNDEHIADYILNNIL